MFFSQSHGQIVEKQLGEGNIYRPLLPLGLKRWEKESVTGIH